MNLRNVIDALRAKTVDNGCTEDEAMAAALKVRELLAKHGEPTEELESWTQEAFANSLEMHILTNLWSGICDYCRVSALAGPHKSGLQFIGPESGVVFAEWLAPTLLGYVLRATEEHMKGYPRGKGIGDTKREKLSFAIGCAARISQRMSAESEPWDRKKWLVAWAEKKGIKIVKGKANGAAIKSSAMDAGRAAAEGARWDRPVNGGGEVRRLS